MKSILFKSIPLVIILFFSCSTEVIKGSGNIVEQIRDVPSFNKIDSEGIFDVTVKYGIEPLIKIMADDNVINNVITEVSGETLKLHLDDDKNYKNIEVKVVIELPILEQFSNKGTSNITISEVGPTETFTLKNEGAGDIVFSGTSTELIIENEGSGKLSGFEFYSTNCDLTIIGSGDVQVNCNTTLSVNIEGSANVYYKGSPSINSEIKGSGEVIDAN